MLRSAHIRTSALAAAFAAASCALPSAAVAAAAAPATFSVRPAHFNPEDPATRAYFIETGRDNQTIQDQVIVNNAGTEPVQLRIYPVDGLTGATSGAVYGDAGDALRKAGRWVTPSVNFVTLGPRSTRLIAFAVQIPAGTAAGDHLAGIAVENAHPQRSGGHFSITEVVRTVVGVEVEVPGPGRPRGVLTGLHLAALPSTQVPSVTVGLGNSGLRLCKPLLTTAINGSSGPATTVTRQLDTILPGDTIPYAVPWPRALQAGRYLLSATLSGCGATVSLRQVARLGGTLAGTAANPNATPSQGASAESGLLWVIAGLAALIVVGLVVLLLWLLLGRRRRRWDDEARPAHS